MHKEHQRMANHEHREQREEETDPRSERNFRADRSLVGHEKGLRSDIVCFHRFLLRCRTRQFGFKKSKTPFPRRRITVSQSPVSLLDGHKRADRDFGKEFASRFRGESNATMRCRIIRHYPGVHSEIEATQAHEIRHVHFVDGGTMVSLLIGNYKLTGLCGVALATGRTLRAVYRHAVFNESYPLQSKRNFDAQLVRRRPAAEKNLRGTPVTRLRGNI